MTAIVDTPAALRFEPIKPEIGSVVRIDRARICDEDVVQACRRELEERGVLVFSDRPTPYDLLFFTAKRATLRAPELLAMVALHTFTNLEGHPTQCQIVW